MAVGDSYNGMGMPEIAGLGVCMDNGVAQAVERFVLATSGR